MKEGSMKFNCVDTGPVRDYGNPKFDTDIQKFANYVRGNEVFGREVYDFILDDGRSRVAVAYQAFRHMNEDSILVIHDYPEDGEESERFRYRNVEKYFEKIDAAARLSVFRKRPGMTIPEDVYDKELLIYH
jgi:hypothetical protein